MVGRTYSKHRRASDVRRDAERAERTWARTRTRWARSPPVAEMENRDSFLLLVPKLKEQVAPVS
jgi:hypothetical protein